MAGRLEVSTGLDNAGTPLKSQPFPAEAPVAPTLREARGLARPRLRGWIVGGAVTSPRSCSNDAFWRNFEPLPAGALALDFVTGGENIPAFLRVTPHPLTPPKRRQTRVSWIVQPNNVRLVSPGA